MGKLSEEVINSLSISLREKISNISKENISIEELRLRSLKPLIINADNRDYFYNTKLNKLDLKMDNPYIVTKDDIEQTFQIYVNFLRNTLDGYRAIDKKINNDIEANVSNLDVNS